MTKNMASADIAGKNSPLCHVAAAYVISAAWAFEQPRVQKVHGKALHKGEGSPHGGGRETNEEWGIGLIWKLF
jgi:hypothetical protein